MSNKKFVRPYALLSIGNAIHALAGVWSNPSKDAIFLAKANTLLSINAQYHHTIGELSYRAATKTHARNWIACKAENGIKSQTEIYSRWGHNKYPRPRINEYLHENAHIRAPSVSNWNTQQPKANESVGSDVTCKNAHRASFNSYI